MSSFFFLFKEKERSGSVKIGLLGYGTVGSAFYAMAIEHPETSDITLLDLKRHDDLTCRQTADFQDILRDESIGTVVELIGGLHPAYEFVSSALKSGKHVLLMLEPERAAQVKRNMPEAFCLYVEPADPAQLRARYAKNARNSYELTARMELAAEQRAESGYCDMRIDSTDPAAAVREIRELIDRL